MSPPSRLDSDSPLGSLHSDRMEIRRLRAERDRYRQALETIRDHGTANGHKCWALHQGDCADVFQETARAALDG